MITEDKLKHTVVSAIIAVALNLFLPWWVEGAPYEYEETDKEIEEYESMREADREHFDDEIV